jgi:hypothetical protein
LRGNKKSERKGVYQKKTPQNEFDTVTFVSSIPKKKNHKAPPTAPNQGIIKYNKENPQAFIIRVEEKNIARHARHASRKMTSR